MSRLTEIAQTAQTADLYGSLPSPSPQYVLISLGPARGEVLAATMAEPAPQLVAALDDAAKYPVPPPTFFRTVSVPLWNRRAT